MNYEKREGIFGFHLHFIQKGFGGLKFIKKSENIEPETGDSVNHGNRFAAPKVLHPFSWGFKNVALNPQLLEKNRCVGLSSASPVANVYKVLRSRMLRMDAKRNIKTIMITSAYPSEGKTLTAINLAASFAKARNSGTLLVDCDFRQQKVHTYLGIHGEKNLVDFFMGECALEEIVLRPNIQNFMFISGERTLEESTELVGSTRMRQLVDFFRDQDEIRYILFDLPPVLCLADAMSFADNVDAILVVVAANETPLSDVQTVVDWLPKEKIVGYVLNYRKPFPIDYGLKGYDRYLYG